MSSNCVICYLYFQENEVTLSSPERMQSLSLLSGLIWQFRGKFDTTGLMNLSNPMFWRRKNVWEERGSFAYWLSIAPFIQFIINLRCPLKSRNISRGFTRGMLLLQNGIGRLAARTSTFTGIPKPQLDRKPSTSTLRSLTWQVITENRYKATKKWWPAFSCFGISPIMRLMLTTFLFLALSDVTLGIFFDTPVRNMTIKSPHELFHSFC